MTDVTITEPAALAAAANLLANDECLIISGGVIKRLPKAEMLANRVVEWDLSSLPTEDAKHKEGVVEGFSTNYTVINDDVFGGSTSPSESGYATLTNALPATGTVFAILGATSATATNAAVSMYIGSPLSPITTVSLDGANNRIKPAMGGTEYATDWDGTSNILVEIDIAAGEVYVNYLNTGATPTRALVGTGFSLVGASVNALFQWTGAVAYNNDGAVFSTNVALLTGGLAPTAGYTAIQQTSPATLPETVADGDIIKITGVGTYSNVGYSVNDLLVVSDKVSGAVSPIMMGDPTKTTYVGNVDFLVPTDYPSVGAAMTAAGASEVLGGSINIVIESGHVCGPGDGFTLNGVDYSHVNIRQEDAIVDWSLPAAGNVSGLWGFTNSKFGTLAGHHRLITSNGNSQGLILIRDTSFAGIGNGSNNPFTSEDFGISATYTGITTTFMYVQDITAVNSFSTAVGNNSYLGGFIHCTGNVTLDGGNNQSVTLTGDGTATQKITVRDYDGAVTVAGGAKFEIIFDDGSAMSGGERINSSHVGIRKSSGIGAGYIVCAGISDNSPGGIKVVSFDTSDWEFDPTLTIMTSSLPIGSTLSIEGNAPAVNPTNLTAFVNTMGAGSKIILPAWSDTLTKTLRGDQGVLGNGEIASDGSMAWQAGRPLNGMLSQLDDGSVGDGGYPAAGERVVQSIKKLAARTLEANTVAAAAIPAAEKGAANGVASLDAQGRIPSSQLSVEVLRYLGNWNASTNTPTLADGSGEQGDTYRVSVAATVDLGSGAVEFGVGDWVTYNGSIWEKSDNADAVVSVAGMTGVITVGQLETVLNLGTAAQADTTDFATAAQGAAADAAIPATEKGAASGVAELDAGSKVPVAQLPADALRQAAFVANADGTDTTTLAASIDALRDALIASGQMAAS